MKNVLVAAAFLTLVAAPVFAQRPIEEQKHSWSTYHWQKTSSQIAPPVHNNVTSAWDSYFDRAMADWNNSTVIQSPYGAGYGPISTAKRCTSATGKIEVCNERYGQTGWLGIAGISLSGGHIVKGYTKLNDTYFETAKYNTPAWRRMVMCQEIGHDYGLGHVNENFDDPNTGSCMDYSNDPSRNDGFGTNEYPNKHDYDQLLIIYNHTESAASPIIDNAVDIYSTHTMSVEELLAGANQWGAPVSYDSKGRPNVFVLRTPSPNHGDDDHATSLTHVFWAPEDPFDHRNGPRDREE